jgi:hypothetical protein
MNSPNSHEPSQREDHLNELIAAGLETVEADRILELPKDPKSAVRLLATVARAVHHAPRRRFAAARTENIAATPAPRRSLNGRKKVR